MGPQRVHGSNVATGGGIMSLGKEAYVFIGLMFSFHRTAKSKAGGGGTLSVTKKQQEQYYFTSPFYKRD